MSIIVTDSGVTVNGVRIEFEGKTSESFLADFLSTSGVTYEEVMQYRKDRFTTGRDQFLDEVLQVVININSLRACQIPFSAANYHKAANSDYYNRFVVNTKSIVPGSVDESIVVPKGTRRR